MTINFQDICVGIVAMVCLAAIANTLEFDPINYAQKQWAEYAPTLTTTPPESDAIPHDH